jgi:branched-chain amino acid transport system substrate-binding protein
VHPKWIARWTGLALATALLALPVPGARGELQTIKVVTSLPRIGSAQRETARMEDAIRLALEEVDHRVGDFAIAYEALDDAGPGHPTSDARGEVRNATRAVGDADVMAYIGPYSSAVAPAAIPILNRAHLAMVSPTASFPGLTKRMGSPASGEPETATFRPASGTAPRIRLPGLPTLPARSRSA